MPKAGELVIKLKQIKGVRGDEAFGFGKADMFATLSIGGEKQQSKTVVDGGGNAVWDEEIRFRIAEYVNFALYHTLKVFIYDEDSVTSNSRRGTAIIDIKSLLDEHSDEVPDLEHPVMFKGEQKGVLILGLSFVTIERSPSVTSSGRMIDIPAEETIAVQREPEPEEANVFSSLVHKFRHLGHRGRRRLDKKLSESVHTIAGVGPVSGQDADEEKHRGWTSEEESEDDYVYEAPATPGK